MTTPSAPAAERVLVLTPTGRDADMVRERLAAAGMACEICPDLDALLAGVGDAGAAVVAQEALSPASAERLLAALEAQEPWSDLPVLLLSEELSRSRRAAQVPEGLFEGANVTLLQRPLSLSLFLSSVRSAVRARRRQYQMRELFRELERAVQLSDLFVSILGHDLRTPLGAIKLSAETIVRLAAEPRVLRPAGRILTSADRMTRMIEQLLDFARVRQGRGIPLKPRSANLAELSRQIVQELEDANPQATLQVQDSGNLTGVWDADRLAQVVSNLAGNAVQHGRSGKAVTLELDGSDGAVVRLRFHNAGTIPPESAPSLFQPFRRAEAPGTSRSGLGLGLFIAREIARAHGGDITVGSTDGDSTTFEVILPRDAAATGP